MGLFTNAMLAWLATAYGVLIAPAVEEIFFRGFLLPSIGLYTGSIVAAAITSACFALLHAEQTGFAWGAVAMLFCVSLVLCAVRLRFRSVAASTLVHVCYNSTLFISLIHATGGYRHFEAIR
jgi:membrane protease YdiL (CAAX protease family)